jgi:hypothetical protein
MKKVLVFMSLIPVFAVDAQVVPANPRDWTTRNIDGGNSVSGNVKEVERQPRKITYVAVCETRDWKNSDGRTIQAALVAWEEGEAAKGRLDLTLLQDGKVRLLLPGNRVTPYPLAKLSEDDRKFIDGLVRARKQAEEARRKEAGAEDQR